MKTIDADFFKHWTTVVASCQHQSMPECIILLLYIQEKGSYKVGTWTVRFDTWVSHRDYLSSTDAWFHFQKLATTSVIKGQKDVSN